MAICQNCNDLFGIRKSVVPTLMRNKNFDDADTHNLYYPKSIDNWCKYGKDILTGEKIYKDYVNIWTVLYKTTMNHYPEDMYVSRNIIEVTPVLEFRPCFHYIG